MNPLVQSYREMIGNVIFGEFLENRKGALAVTLYSHILFSTPHNDMKKNYTSKS